MRTALLIPLVAGILAGQEPERLYAGDSPFPAGDGGYGERPGRIAASGFVKEYSQVTQSPVSDSLGRDRTESLHLGRVRLKLRWTPTADVDFDAAWELLWSSRRLDDTTSVYRARGSAAAPTRVDDLDTRLGTSGRSALYQDLDRLSLTLHGTAADFVLGRQAISFGSGRVFNPTDILAPFGFTDVDQEEKPGVDALRLTAPIGQLSDVDLIYAAGHRWTPEESGPLARFRGHWAGTDAAILAAYFRRDWVLGLDLAGSVLGAGWWAEATWTRPQQRRDPTWNDDGYWRLSTGADRQLTESLYAFIEYDFVSFGAMDADAFPSVLRVPAVMRGVVTTLGRHYLTVGFRRQLHPLIHADANCLVNVTDPSALFSGRIEWSLSDNAVLTAGMYLPFGARAESHGPGVVVWHSEFGTYPRSVFVQVRLYF